MFELAERLGMTVGQLGRVMSSRELTEWMALEALRERKAVRRALDQRALAGAEAILAAAKARRGR